MHFCQYCLSMKKSDVSVVIPARLASTRLAGKILADLGGKPVLRHVWEHVSQMHLANEIHIATDAEQVRQEAQSWGASVFMTSPECRSGTERIVSILDQLKGKFILNVQGDEPFIDPALLDALIERWQATQCELVTPVFQIHKMDELFNPNIVKVVRGSDGRALYFSRSAIPYVRGIPQEKWLEKNTFWGHLGVYGFSKKILETYPSIAVGKLEQLESLEQLRLVEAGYSFQTIETAYRSVAIDTPEDLEKARQLIYADCHGKKA